MTARVFISLTGPDDNLGDIFIRRESLDWVRGSTGVVAYVGDHPQRWIEAIGFSPQDRLIRGGVRGRAWWMLRCLISVKRPVLVTDPGETWVTARQLLPHVAYLIVALLLKARGGRIVIPPHAVAQQRVAPIFRPTLALHGLFVRLADIALWREPRSLAITGHGQLAADIALTASPRLTASIDERRLCVVSLRGDRPTLPAHAVNAVTAAAGRADLDLVVLAQVETDLDSSRMMAERIGGSFVQWDRRDPESEERIRAIYDSAKLVISDRLHVLLLGLISGAMPVEMVGSPERKIAAHLEAVGLEDISIDVTDRSTEDLTEWLSDQVSRREDAVAAMTTSHAQLLQIREHTRLLTAT